MEEEVKVVARMKTGETLKGFATRPALDNMNGTNPVYLRLANPGNTVGVYISSDQLEGLFIVNTFSGNRPNLTRRWYYDFRKYLKNNGPLISAAAFIAFIFLTGVIVLL